MVISLIGNASGAVVVFCMLIARRLPACTLLSLVTTVATSATGFLFHSVSFAAPHVVGVISLVVLAVAIAALYVYHLTGAWRWIYVASAVTALYLNVFV